MNILVTGANGQLGNEMRLLAATGSCPGPDARFIFTDINQASEEAVAMLRRLAGGAAVDTSTRTLDITDLDAGHATVAVVGNASRVSAIAALSDRANSPSPSMSTR